MRILHIIGTMDPRTGGVCQAIRTMISGLSALGVSNEVCSLDDPSASFLSSDPLKIHAEGPGSGPWYYSSKLAPWLNKNLDRYDVVILHGLWLYNGYAVRKAVEKQHLQQKEKGVKNTLRLFIMPHGMLDPYFQKASGRRLKALRNHLYWQLIEKKIVNGSEGVLFTCELEKQLARGSFHPYKPKKEIVVGLAVDEPPAYQPSMNLAFREKCSGLGDRPYFLFLSRIHPKKGAGLLVNAYGKLKKEYLVSKQRFQMAGGHEEADNQTPDFPALVIAGPGLETPYGQELALLEDADAAANDIFFPGMLSGEAKWGAFYGCEAFVLPSHQENFGIAVVEALACRRAVLISNQINICEEIKAGGGGIIQPDNMAGTCKLLATWQEMDEDEKLTMGIKARNIYRKNFSVARMAKELLEVFEPKPSAEKNLIK
jgi:glycosyltransferase involved in cell wall biosynthesis